MLVRKSEASTVEQNPITTKLKLINWNIGGAKYLELREKKDVQRGEKSREKFKDELNKALEFILSTNPHIVTLQEVTMYEEHGNKKNAECIIKPTTIIDYDLIDYMLIDTERHSHQGKWNKIIEKGGWDRDAFFAQGNAILVRKDITEQMHPIMSLPGHGVTYTKWLDANIAAGSKLESSEIGKSVPIPTFPPVATNISRVEDIYVFSGLYFGNRDTEPRAASVIHLTIDDPQNDNTPRDIFVINTHLTTLTTEREGVPSIDKEASKKRLVQLDIIMDGIISEYNIWRKDEYKIRGEKAFRLDEETETRSNPIWLIAGDFNFTPDSKEYREIIAQNFTDLIKDHARGTKSHGLGKDPRLTVDYVFAGPLFGSIDKNE